MADKKLRDFHKRTARLEKAYAKGYGFEAAGTLGRSHYRQRRRLRFGFIMPLVVLCGALLVLKSAMALRLDAEVYADRVETLRHGTVLEQAGAVILQPDPLSGAVAGWVERTF